MPADSSRELVAVTKFFKTGLLKRTAGKLFASPTKRLVVKALAPNMERPCAQHTATANTAPTTFTFMAANK